jgi:hypothetical protein
VRWATPGERAEIERLADAAGVTVAEALREGAREWLLARQPIDLNMSIEIEMTVTYDDATAYTFAHGGSVYGEIIGGAFDGAPVRFGPAIEGTP